DAPTLFLDEPFVGVDRPSEELLEQLFVDLAQEGRGIMVATHDIEQTYRYDRVLCLNGRQVALGPPLQTLTRDLLETTYGGAIAIAFVGRIPLIERDTGVAVVITSLFGLGVVLALSPSSPPGLESLLFGDLLGVTRGDLVISSVLVAATCAAVVTLHRPLL